MKGFSIEEAFSFGLDKSKKHWKILLGALLVSWVLPGIPNIVSEFTKESVPVLSSALEIFSSLFSLFLSIGFTRITFFLHDHDEANISNLFSGKDVFVSFVLGSILYTLIILGGFLLLIIPGIILSLKYQFTQNIIIDKGMGPIEALKESSLLTEGVKLELLKFGAILIVFNLLGILFFGIGIFATIPVSAMAGVFVYRQLQSQV